MADNEFLRKKREREFQQLVLQSLEKPKTSKFLAFINSGFFLWFLSAVFVTAAGWYITNYQQCAAQSSELAENIRKLSAALSFHFDDFDTFIVAQTDVNSILQGSPGYATMRGEYDKRSVLEVNKELQTLMKKVNFSPWDDFLWPRPSEELKQTEQFYVRDIFTRPRRLNVSLDQLVDALRKLTLRMHLQTYPGIESDFRRVCGPIDLVRRNLLVENVPLVRAALPTGFDNTEGGRSQIVNLYLVRNAHP